MDMGTKSVVGLIAGGSLVAGLWGKIKALASRIWSIAFYKAHVSNRSAQALQAYCWKHMRRSPLGVRCFSSEYVYIKKDKRREHVAYEFIGTEPIWFWQGYKFIIFGIQSKDSSDQKEGYNIGEDTQGARRVTVTFFRPFWKFDKLLKTALDEYNRIQRGLMDVENSVEKRRFWIKRITVDPFAMRYGTGQQNIEEPDNKSSKGISSQGFYTQDRRWIGHQADNLGGCEVMDGNALDRLAYPQHVLDVVEEVRVWRDSKEWYESRGIPWRRGLLLYGTPGCGKTSLVRAIGMDLGLPVFIYDIATLPNSIMISKWAQMMASAPCIALIDDIDCTFNYRKNIIGEMGGGLTFECLLNCLDGVEIASGVLTIITTNDIEKLDPAIGIVRDKDHEDSDMGSTRPGRVDRVVHLIPPDESCRSRIVDIVLPELKSNDVILKRQLIDQGDGDTGAQFVDRCASIAIRERFESIVSV